MFTDDYGNRRFPGLYRGIVFDTRDPLTRGRLRVQVPQVLGDAVTDWAWAKRDPGAPEATPAVGAGVWVQFEGGDPSYPVWVGTFSSSAAAGGGGGASALDGLTDVAITGVIADNEVLAYDSTSSSWINQTLAEAGIVATGDARLTDTRTPTDGSVTTAKIVDANVTNAKLANSSITVNGSAISLGGSATVTAVPTAHASTHTSGGSDAITVAQSQVTSLTTDLAAKAPLASPTFTGTVTAPLTTAGYVTTTSGGVLGSVATIPNAGLTNSAVTVNGSSVSLGGTVTVGAAPTGSAGGKLSGTYPNPGINASLDDLNDVTVTGTPADNNLVAWNSATSQWTNQTAAQAGVIATPNGAGTSITLNGLTNAEGINVTRYVDIGGADDDFSPSLTVQANEDIDGEYPIAVFKGANGTQVGGVSAQGVIDATELTRSGTPVARVYSQTTQPSGGNIGDIWIDTDSAQNTIGATPRFEGSRVNTNQSIPNSTQTTLTYPTIVENVGGFVYNAGVITMPLTGRYAFTVNPRFEPNQGGRRFIRVYKNSTGSTPIWEVRVEPPGSVGDGVMFMSVTSDRFTGGDTIIFQVQQVSGSSLNITDARLVIEYLGA